MAGLSNLYSTILKDADRARIAERLSAKYRLLLTTVE